MLEVEELQSPYGAFCLQHGHASEEAKWAWKVAIPLRGFLFATGRPPAISSPLCQGVAIPLRGFLFATIFYSLSSEARLKVAIPLRGFLFATAYPVNRRPVKGS